MEWQGARDVVVADWRNPSFEDREGEGMIMKWMRR
jgi:hypothetical protein